MATHEHELSAPVDREAFLKMASYPLVRQSDMSEETRLEAIDICSTGARRAARRARSGAPSNARPSTAHAPRPRFLR